MYSGVPQVLLLTDCMTSFLENPKSQSFSCGRGHGPCSSMLSSCTEWNTESVSDRLPLSYRYLGTPQRVPTTDKLDRLRRHELADDTAIAFNTQLSTGLQGQPGDTAAALRRTLMSRFAMPSLWQ